MFFVGFGPEGSRLSPSERLKDIYSHGISPNGDSSRPGGHTNTIPSSGSLTDTHPGVHTSNGRGGSSMGSDSFLNRPVNGQSGKTIDNQRPSILATRRPFSNGSGSGSGYGPGSGSGSGTDFGAFKY